MKTLTATIAILLTSAVGVSAADLAAQQPYTKAPSAAAVVSSWTGPYVGGAVGWLGSREDWTTDLIWPSRTPAVAGRLGLGGPTANFNANGFRGAVFAGYNHQVGQSFVVGLEGDLGWATNNKSTMNYLPGTVLGAPGTNTPLGDRLTISRGFDASIRGRVGYLVTPGWLAYATGGVAFQQETIDVVCPGGGAGNSRWCIADRFAKPSTIHVGWTVGAGLEGKVTSNVTGRVEYRYSDLGTWNNGYFVGSNGDEMWAHTRLTSHTVMFGAAYQFPIR